MIIVVTCILTLVIYILVLYNVIIKQILSIQHSKSLIDVYLSQRFDLIPNLVECVKTYTIYEKNLFEKITKLRIDYFNDKELIKGGILDTESNKTILILENYPELKANEQFSALQKNLTKMENQIQAARRIYNNDVEKYNRTISIFPNNIVAKILQFKKEAFFEMEEQ